MPIYRYLCRECGAQTDGYRHVDDRHKGPACCGATMQIKIMPTMVQPDIQSYVSVAVDKETGKRVQIHSRRQHREFLKRNDYVEVGNDFKPKPRRDDGPADAPMLSVEEMKKHGFVEEAL